MSTRKLITLLVLWAGLFFPTGFSFAQPQLTASLQETLARGEDEFIRINIRLAEQYDSQLLLEKTNMLSNDNSRRLVIEELQKYTSRKQASLVSLLNQKEAEGAVKNIHPFWIINLISCKVKPEVIQELLSFSEIGQIDIDIERMVIHHEEEKSLMGMNAEDKYDNVTWNVSLVNAPQAWEEGYQGQGVVVAVLDTGVNYNHVDLKDNMWEHPEFPFFGYNTYSDNYNTMDNGGHGTHVAGTVAGNGTSGLRTGIAPRATIMSVKVLSSIGSGWEAQVWAGIEFAVEQGADIMSLSLSWRPGWNPDYTMWRSLMDNALAAGMVAAVATGNAGSINTPLLEVGTPANAPPPWLHPSQELTGGVSAVIAVGSTTFNDDLSSFSSKGPCTWQDVEPYLDYPYDPQMGLIRPDVVAPGSEIISLDYEDIYGYTVKNGTSMATPAVSGVLALMLSKNPYLTPAQLSQIIEESALALGTPKNNTFGSGRVDALAAVMATPHLGFSSIEIDDSEGNNDGLINPGEKIKLNLLLENTTQQAFHDLSLSLEMPSPYITLSDSILFIGSVEPGQEIELSAAVSFMVSDSIPGYYPLEMLFTITPGQQPDMKWERYFQTTAFAPKLEVMSFSIDDSAEGNNNGILDPGETAQFSFELHNNGQLPSEDIIIRLEGLHPLFDIYQPLLSVPPLDPGQTYTAEFILTAHHAVPQGFISSLILHLSAGAYLYTDHFAIKIGTIVEDWAEGFDNFSWTFEGQAEWYFDAQEFVSGPYSARSGNISHNQSSVLIMEYDVLTADTIAFYRKVSSENNRDWLEFYIDGELQVSWSGMRNWERFAFPVQSGLREFRWVYIKDPSTSIGQDCAWIDNIELPATAQTFVVAGFDKQVCGTAPVELDGFAAGYDTLEWTTDGDGSFSHPHSESTIYSPGTNDIALGRVNISLNITNDTLPDMNDSFLLQFVEQPEVSLGEDATLCTNHTLLLDAGQQHAAYLWFDGSTDQTYLVDYSNFNQPEVSIWVTVFHENGCMAIDTLNVIFDDCVGVDEIQKNHTPRVFPNPANDKVYVSFLNEHSIITTVTFINISGQKIWAVNQDTPLGVVGFDIDISALIPGLYFIRIDNGNSSFTEKLIIK